MRKIVLKDTYDPIRLEVEPTATVEPVLDFCTIGTEKFCRIWLDIKSITRLRDYLNKFLEKHVS